MARDPQKIKKAYDEDRSVAYKLPDHILKDLDEDQIKDLSAVYNMMSADEKKEFGKGTGDLMDLARQMSDPLQEKYNTGGLDSWTGKPKENSNAKQGPMPMPSAKKPKKEEKEKIPEGLDSLLKDIRSEVGSETPKKSGALAVIPKPDKVKEETLVDEDIDPRILKLLGIEDTTGLDYSDYKSLLKEKMAADRMGGNKGDSGDAELLTNEYKRIKGSTGKFKVKSQKIKAQSFVAKTKSSSAAVSVTPQLPPAAPQEEVAQVVDPKRQSADKTFALIASKLEIVDRNVQETAAYLTKKDVAEKKEKDATKKETQNAAAAERENRTENRNIFAAIPGVVGAAVKPIKDALGGFFDGLKRLGFAVFIMELMRFLRDPAKYINDIIDWTNKQVKKLETSIENFVIDKMVKPMNGMIKGLNDIIGGFVDKINPVLQKLSFLGIQTQLNKNDLKVPEIKESDIRNSVALPQISNVDKDFLNFGQVDSSGKPETAPQETLMGGDSSSGRSDKTGAFLDTISYAEGTPSYGTIYGGAVVPELAAGEMTVGEVMEMQKTGKYKGRDVGYKRDSLDSDATGKYQFMSYVLKEEVEKQKIPLSAKFTPELQDKMILSRLLTQRGITQEMIETEGMSDKMIDRLAPEFASFPNLMGDVRYGYGTSYYGQGGKSKEQIKEVYKKQREKKPTQAPPPTSVEPLLPPTEDQQQLKLQEQRKRTEELLKGDPRFTPQASVPNITPPVQKASLTTIGGAGSQGPQSPTSAAAGTQSQVVAFSASDSTNLSVMGAKSVYGVVG